MEKIEKITIKLLMLLIGFSLLFPVRALAAEKDEITEKKQIIFLLDASKSMQGDGQWIEAADSACMIASALPKEYEVALLVYNTEIVYEEDFGNINQKTRHALESAQWQRERRLLNEGISFRYIGLSASGTAASDYTEIHNDPFRSRKQKACRHNQLVFILCFPCGNRV